MQAPNVADPGVADAGAASAVGQGTSFLGSISQGISSFATTIIDPILSVVGTAFSAISTFIGNVADAIIEGVKGLYSAAKNIFSSLSKGMKNFFKGVGDLFKPAGDFINNLFLKPMSELTQAGIATNAEKEFIDQVIIKPFRQAIIEHLSEKNNMNAFETQLVRGFVMDPKALFTMEDAGEQFAYIGRNFAYAGISWGQNT